MARTGSSDISPPNNGTTVVTTQPTHAASPINNAEPILAFWRSKSSMDKISKGGRNVSKCVSSTCTKLYLPSLSQSHCHLPILNYSTNEHMQIRYVNTPILLLYHFSSHLLGYHMPVYFIVRAILQWSQCLRLPLWPNSYVFVIRVSCWSRFKNSWGWLILTDTS